MKGWLLLIALTACSPRQFLIECCPKTAFVIGEPGLRALEFAW